MDKDDDKKAATPVQPAKPAPAPAPAPVREAPKEEAPAPELSAPTLTEGRVDELAALRNEQGQLTAEDGSSPDELADGLKAKFSGHGGGDF